MKKFQLILGVLLIFIAVLNISLHNYTRAVIDLALASLNLYFGSRK